MRHLKSSILPVREVALGLSHEMRADGDGLLPRLQEQVQKARNAWNRKVGELKDFLKGYDAIGLAVGEDDLFNSVLRLFVASILEQQLAVKKIDQRFQECSQDVEFFIPHLLIYLLYGAFESEDRLRFSLLAMCQQSLPFACKVHWYVSAFCLQHAGVRTERMQALDSLLSSVVECGEAAAQVLSDRVCPHPAHAVTAASSSNMPSYGTVDAVMEEQEGCLAPIGGTGFYYPLHITKLPPADMPLFQSQLAFWKALADISRSLAALPRKMRTPSLREELIKVLEQFLPSAVIHLPFGNTQHRLWALHVEECLVFNTKDRAPVLLCMEVVHYAEGKRKKARKWWRMLAKSSASSSNLTSAGISSSGSLADMDHAAPALDLDAGLGQWDSSPRRSSSIGKLHLQRHVSSPTDGSNGLVSTDDEGSAVEEVADTVVFKEKWRKKTSRLRASSVVGSYRGWALVPVIVKAGDDLRQEQLASHVVQFMHGILQASRTGSQLRPYAVLALSPDSGVIEAVPNTVSLDIIKQPELGYHTLPVFFLQHFGAADSAQYLYAQQNFILSLAAYSVLCYLLNLRDRHNGNILLTTHGHIVHIDFGFLLGSTPGGNLDFEQAPFKLTSEYVELMGGQDSKGFVAFRECCVTTFLELRKHSRRIMLFLEMLSKGNEHLPCFAESPQRVLQAMHGRFFPEMNDHAAKDMVNKLINQSLDHWTTGAYDGFQRCCMGIQ